MRTLIAVVGHVAAALATLGALWMLAATMELAPRVEVARRAGEYVRAELLVEKIERSSHKRKGGSSSYGCAAVGTIDGVEERLALTDCIEENGRVVTEQAVAGKPVDVLVNRTISPHGVLGSRRTLRYRDNLEMDAWRQVADFAPYVYAPVVLPLALAFAMWLVGRLAYGRGSGLWCLWPVGIAVGLQGVAIALAQVWIA